MCMIYWENTGWSFFSFGLTINVTDFQYLTWLMELFRSFNQNLAPNSRDGMGTWIRPMTMKNLISQLTQCIKTFCVYASPPLWCNCVLVDIYAMYFKGALKKIMSVPRSSDVSLDLSLAVVRYTWFRLKSPLRCSSSSCCSFYKIVVPNEDMKLIVNFRMHRHTSFGIRWLILYMSVVWIKNYMKKKTICSTVCLFGKKP